MLKNNKENIAFFIGVILIGLVFLTTFVRQGFNKKEEDSNSQLEIPADYPVVYPKEIGEKINRSEDIQILDLRNQLDFDTEHILNSINIPLENLQKEGDILDPSKETVVIYYTESKADISEAIKLLQRNGFQNIAVLYEGLSGWKNGFFHTVTNGNPDSASDQSKIIYISLEEFQTMINTNDNIFILDVRDSNSFNTENIHNSANIPLSELEKRRNEIPKLKKVLVYGQEATESFQAGTKLFDLNFLNIRTLDGGFDEWKEFIALQQKTEDPPSQQPEQKTTVSESEQKPAE
jgi:rhodanese-related sulfurtransferase